jgi:uncharacterized membrane protein YfcA
VEAFLVIAAIGLLVGFLGGLFGKGGSAVATPLLHLAGVPAIAAVASPLPATVPGTLVAADSYRKVGLIDRHIVGWSAAVGVPATILGAIATIWISGSFLVALTEVILAIIGLRILLRRDQPEVAYDDEPPSRVRVIAVGATAGLAAGLLANSGGFLLAPLYLTITRLQIKPALAASLAVSAALAVPGTLVHMALGHIDWSVAATLALTSIPASHYGARVALRTQSAQLERIYGAGLTLLGLTLLMLR